MFGNAEYEVYADLMKRSEEAYKSGNMDRYDELIEESNVAFEAYEYAAGLKSFEEY